MRRFASPVRCATLSAFDYVADEVGTLFVERGRSPSCGLTFLYPAYRNGLRIRHDGNTPLAQKPFQDCWVLDAGCVAAPTRLMRCTSVWSTRAALPGSSADHELDGMASELARHGGRLYLYGSRLLFDRSDSDWDLLLVPGGLIGMDVVGLITDAIPGARACADEELLSLFTLPVAHEVIADADLLRLLRAGLTYFVFHDLRLDLMLRPPGFSIPIPTDDELSDPANLRGTILPGNGGSWAMPRQFSVELRDGKLARLATLSWFLQGMESLAGTEVVLTNVRRERRSDRVWFSSRYSHLGLEG